MLSKAYIPLVGGGNRWSGASHRSVPAPGSLSVRPDCCSTMPSANTRTVYILSK